MNIPQLRLQLASFSVRNDLFP